jgi:mannose-1-phosphate guanylyltransferase
VARATFRWDDVGAWDAIARTRPADERGNIGIGATHLVECDNCIAWAEEGSIVVFGASDLVVVRTGDVTFVAPRERTAALKDLLRQLPESLLRRKV